jgi:hypothetical protein
VAGISGLVDLCEEGRLSKNTFQQDRAEEFDSYAHSFLELSHRSVEALANGHFMESFNGPAEADFILRLMHHFDGHVANTERYRRLIEYLDSEYFCQVPFVDISRELFAILRKRVRKGQYKNSKKAKSRLRGFFYDIERSGEEWVVAAALHLAQHGKPAPRPSRGRRIAVRNRTNQRDRAFSEGWFWGDMGA